MGERENLDPAAAVAVVAGVVDTEIGRSDPESAREEQAERRLKMKKVFIDRCRLFTIVVLGGLLVMFSASAVQAALCLPDAMLQPHHGTRRNKGTAF